MPKKEIDYLDVEVLAAYMCGKSEDDDRDTIEEAFHEKFGVELDAFEALLEVMWPLLTFGISPITDTPFIGFAQRVEGAWIIKKDASNDFLSAVVQWLGGNEIKKSGKGAQRDITINGKKEFEITIVKE